MLYGITRPLINSLATSDAIMASLNLVNNGNDGSVPDVDITVGSCGFQLGLL